MQYNVLADKYASFERYFYCPTDSLQWKVRGKLLIQEILEHDPDILFLQEVDNFQFFVESLPMRGIFTKRSQHSAIFFKPER